MTDVIILHRIPGARAGEIRQLDERMQKHVAAGNARIIPNSHEGWNGSGSSEQKAPPILQAVGMGSATLYDVDEDLLESDLPEADDDEGLD